MEINKSDFLEAGVQFGHYKSQTHHKMKKFVFSIKNGISIIDLRKITSHSLSVYQKVKEIASSGSTILFVSKKRQASEFVKNAALNCESPFVVKKWPGGFLTNFSVISKEISKLTYLSKFIDQNKEISKKEYSRIERKIKKLNDCYEGVLNLKKIPDAVFIFGMKAAEKTVAKEAKKLGITVISICDTDTDPSLIDYLIPGNDDGVKSTVFFVNLISRAVSEGKDLYERSLEKNDENFSDNHDNEEKNSTDSF